MGRAAICSLSFVVPPTLLLFISIWTRKTKRENDQRFMLSVALSSCHRQSFSVIPSFWNDNFRLMLSVLADAENWEVEWCGGAHVSVSPVTQGQRMPFS